MFAASGRCWVDRFSTTAAVAHVVVFVQVDHPPTTTAGRWPGPAPRSSSIGRPKPKPPTSHQPHTRAAYAKRLHAQQAHLPGDPNPVRRAVTAFPY